MIRDKRSKNSKGYLQSGFYKSMISMLMEEKRESWFKSLRDVGVFWGDTKYLLPRTWIYEGPRKSPMEIYFRMRSPHGNIPMHSLHDYIKFCIKRKSIRK